MCKTNSPFENQSVESAISVGKRRKTHDHINWHRKLFDKTLHPFTIKTLSKTKNTEELTRVDKEYLPKKLQLISYVTVKDGMLSL